VVVEAEVEAVAFERAFMLSANTTGDLERAFASIRLGELPERPPLMLAFPSILEDGWAPPGRAALWLSTFVPWRLAAGPWDRAAWSGPPTTPGGPPPRRSAAPWSRSSAS
jgi:phytoene dehydrogenase-like protein